MRERATTRLICIMAGVILATFLVPLAARAWLAPLRRMATPAIAVWEDTKVISHNTYYHGVTSPDNGMKRYSSIAARSNNVYVIWSKREGTEAYSFDPYSNNSSNEGQNWGATDTELQDSDSTETYAPLDLAVDASNNPHYVWAEGPGANYTIYYKYGSNPPEIVETTTDPVAQPAIEVSSNTVHLVWSQGAALNRNIMYESKPVGSGNWLGSPVNISQSAAPPASHPDIAADSSGNLHVVWDEGLFTSTVWYKKRSGGSWLSAETVSGDVARSYRPAIAVHGNNVYVAWCEYLDENEQYVRFSKKSIADGTGWPGTTKRVSTDKTSVHKTISTYILPAIAVDGNGNVHVAWHGGTTSATPEEIFYSSSTNDGNTWSTKSNLSNSVGDSTGPALAVSNNYVHLIWAEQHERAEGRCVYDVYYRRTDTQLPALTITKQADPDPVQAGSQLTYTIWVTNTGSVDLTVTITDVLPDHITTAQPLTWTPTITAPGVVWMEQVVVTVEMCYSGPLTNVVQATTAEGARRVYTETSNVIGYCIYLPVILKSY